MGLYALSWVNTLEQDEVNNEVKEEDSQGSGKRLVFEDEGSLSDEDYSGYNL